MMPVVFMFVLNSFPAALSFYYFVSNLVTFGQQALIRKFVDEDKIKRILDENRKKNVSKKKSKFQMKLEEGKTIDPWFKGSIPKTAGTIVLFLGQTYILYNYFVIESYIFVFEN